MVLRQSSYNFIDENRMDNVWRYMADGQFSDPSKWGKLGDAAGILFVINSDANIITNNQMHGGAEGFFGGGTEAYARGNQNTFAAL